MPPDKAMLQMGPNKLSLNATVPVGGEPDPEYATVAVRVTVPVTGLAGPVTVVDVPAWVTVSVPFTKLKL